jgi:hypothetical protein
MVQIYAGLREQELQAAAAQYVEKFVRGNVFEEVADLVAALSREGAQLWAVSSTNKWVVTEGVRPFGIPGERVLSAEVAVVAGIIGSQIVDVPTDEGKSCRAAPRSDLARRRIRQPVHDLACSTSRRMPSGQSPARAARKLRRARVGDISPAAAEGIEAAVDGE